MPNKTEFKTNTIKVFPKLSLDGLDIIGQIEENTDTKTQFLVLKKVNVDSQGFPRGQAKTSWYPMKHAKAIFQYLLDNLSVKK